MEITFHFPVILSIKCGDSMKLRLHGSWVCCRGFSSCSSAFKEQTVAGLCKVLTCLLDGGTAGDMLTVRVLTFSYRNRSVFHPPAKMNMVKRIMGRPRQEECSPQDNALGLMHLRRLFTELCHPPRHMTQKEQEEKLYMMLPVFNRVSPEPRPAFPGLPGPLKSQGCW